MSSRDSLWISACEAVLAATREPAGLAGFMAINGRLPTIKDEGEPWSFRGWLLPYVMDLERYRRLPGRWGWWLSSLKAGELAGPIPRIEFEEPSGSVRSQLKRVAQRLSEEVWGSSVPGLLIDWLAWGLAVSNERASTKPAAEEWLYRELCLDGWLDNPADYLGWLMCEYKGRGKDPTGFFPTPHGVVQMMAGMLRPIDSPFRTVQDPCIGTGRMLLEASNYSIRLCGQDINPACVKATLVNGALYAPWLSFPLPKMRGEREAQEAAPSFDASGQGLLFGLST